MTEAEVIARARREADARLWPWAEPVEVQHKRSFPFGPRRWRVKTNGASVGLHVIVVLDDAGGVLSANVLRY